MTTRPRGRRATLSLIIVGVLALVWCGYWFASSQIATAAAGKLVASLAAGGRAVACTENATGGFPFSLDLDCSQATFNDRKAGMAVALSRVTATAPLYWPGSVSAEMAGPMALDAPIDGGSFDVEWAKAVAHADAGFSGLNWVALEFDELTMRPRAGGVKPRFAELAADRAELLAEPAAGDAYRFLVVADEVMVKPTRGEDLPPVAARMDMTVLDFGASLGLDPGHAVKAWLARGGTIDVNRLEASFGGAAALASGQLQLSPDGLLSGILTVRLSGLDALPAAVEAIRPGGGKKVAQAVAAAGMFTKAVAGDPNARDAPLVIKDSVVRIGVIPIATIPPLTF